MDERARGEEKKISSAQPPLLRPLICPKWKEKKVIDIDDGPRAEVNETPDKTNYGFWIEKIASKNVYARTFCSLNNAFVLLRSCTFFRQKYLTV